MAIASARGKLIGVIGDEDTCVGFLLGGIGKLTIWPDYLMSLPLKYKDLTNYRDGNIHFDISLHFRWNEQK